MAFSTKNAKRQVMSVEVREWSRAEAPDDMRTLVATLTSNADVQNVQDDLKRHGVSVVSAGPGVIVVSISGKQASAISHIPEVLRLEMPQRYDPNQLQID